MARLTAAARKKLPAKAFAGPGRSFPIEDKIHAQKALQLLPRKKGLSTSQKQAIRNKAYAKLGHKPK